MADNGVRYYVAINGQMQVISALNSMEGAALKTDASMAALAGTMRSMVGALGLGIGAHALISFGKDAVQGAADFEVSMKRIMFASKSTSDGLSNQKFILGEADKFKIPFEDATAAYGKFLAMLAGSKMATKDIQELHDQLLMIGKIKGISDGQLDAAVMNLGKMLESGGLDARHFRPLEMQLSGIGQYVANELGISIHQLAVLRNKGQMSQIDPQVLLTAIRKQAEDLKGYLPESLTTIQSGLNELHNSWLNFKNDLVFDNRAELIGLFDTMKEGIGWLRDNKDTLVFLGKELLFIGKIWLEYKVAMGLVNVATATYQAYMVGYLGESTAVVAATEAKAVAMNSLAAAMERVAFATEAMAGTSLKSTWLMATTGATGLGLSGVPMAEAGLVGAGAGGAAVAGEGLAVGGGLVATIGTALGTAAVIAIIAKLGYDMYEEIQKRKEKHGYVAAGYYYDENTHGIKWSEGVAEKADLYNGGYGLTKPGASVAGSAMNAADITANSSQWKVKKQISPAEKAFGGIAPPNDHITGQRVITINNNFKEINGVKEMTVQSGGKVDKDMIGRELRDIIVEIANDQQIRQGQ